MLDIISNQKIIWKFPMALYTVISALWNQHWSSTAMVPCLNIVLRSSSFLPSEMTLWDDAIFLIYLGCTISGRALGSGFSLLPAPHIQKHCVCFYSHSGMMMLLTDYWCYDFFSSLNVILFQYALKSCVLEILFKMKTYPLLQFSID